MIAYLRLIRLPNVFTALADVAAGFVLARLTEAGGTWWTLGLLAPASGALYAAGMALNDFADREADAVHRPERPIPSGAVSPAQAAAIGAGLLAGGLLLAALAGWASSGGGGARLAPLTVAGGLAAAILLYDFAAKRCFLAGPLALGLCRYLNFQLGLSGAEGFAGRWGDAALWTSTHAPALAVGLYAAALTVFSAQEESGRRTGALAGGALLAGAALVLAGVTAPQPWAWPLLALLAAALAALVWRTARAGTSAAAKDLVRAGVLGVCVLDAALILGHGGLALWPFSAAVAALALPAVLLARVIRQKEA